MEEKNNIKIHEDIAVLKTKVALLQDSYKGLNRKFWSIIILLVANLVKMLMP